MGMTKIFLLRGWGGTGCHRPLSTESAGHECSELLCWTWNTNFIFEDGTLITTVPFSSARVTHLALLACILPNAALWDSWKCHYWTRLGTVLCHLWLRMIKLNQKTKRKYKILSQDILKFIFHNSGFVRQFSIHTSTRMYLSYTRSATNNCSAEQ